MPKRSISVTIKLTEKEFERLNEVSKTCDITKSEVLRQGIDFIQVTEELEDEIHELEEKIEDLEIELENEPDRYEPDVYGDY